MSLLFAKGSLFNEGVSITELKPTETFIFEGQLCMKMDAKDTDCQYFNLETATRQLISAGYKVIPVDIHISKVARKLTTNDDKVEAQLEENRDKFNELKEENNKLIDDLEAKRTVKNTPGRNKVKQLNQESAAAEKFADAANNKITNPSGKLKKSPIKAKTKKKAKSSSGSYKTYTEEELKILYFKKSCELEYWAKTTDFADLDRDNYPSWFTFHHNFGSKSNLVDAVIQELKKDRKDNIKPEYQKIIAEYFGENHTAIYVIKKLSDGSK